LPNASRFTPAILIVSITVDWFWFRPATQRQGRDETLPPHGGPHISGAKIGLIDGKRKKTIKICSNILRYLNFGYLCTTFRGIPGKAFFQAVQQGREIPIFLESRKFVLSLQRSFRFILG
jgi:hypothetical protein